jgi:hypothetical protein
LVTPVECFHFGFGRGYLFFLVLRSWIPPSSSFLILH